MSSHRACRLGFLLAGMLLVGALSSPAEQAPSEPGKDSLGSPLPQFAVARCGSATLRHPDSVWKVRFTPDGKHLVSLAGDGTARVWDAATGIELAEREGVQDLEVSRNGSCALLTSEDVVLVASVPELRTLQRIPLPGMERRHLAISPDAETLATTVEERPEVTLWDVKTGNKVRVFAADSEEEIDSLAWSPDGTSIAAVRRKRRGHSIELWRAATGEKERVLLEGEDIGTEVEFDVTGKTLYALSGGGLVALDVASGASTRIECGASGFLIVPGTRQAITFRHDSVSVQDLDGRAPSRVLWEAPWSRSSVGERGSIDRSNIWMGTGRVYSISGVAVSPDGHRAAVASTEHIVRIFEIATGKETMPVVGPASGGCLGASLSPDGNLVATGTFGDGVYIWETSTGRLQRHFERRNEVCFGTSWSPDGKFVAASTWNAVVVWSTASGGKFAEHTSKESPKGLTWFPDSKTVGFFEKGQLLSWNPTTDRSRVVAKVRDRGYFRLAISPDGKTIATGPRNLEVLLMDAATGAVMAQVPSEGNTLDVAFAHSGRFVASCGSGQGLLVRSASDASVLAEFPVVTQDGECVAWSADDRFLAVAQGDTLSGNPSGDMAIRLVEVASGRVIALFRSHSGRSRWMDFTPDTRRLVTAMEDGTALVWDLDQACGLAPGADPEKGESAAVWKDIGEEDAAAAWQALVRQGPPDSTWIAEFAHRMLEAPAAPSEIAGLIASLSNEDPASRELAEARLREIGAESEIRAALLANPEAEAAARMRAILADAEANPTATRAAELQGVRGVAFLERCARGAASSGDAGLRETCRKSLASIAESAPWGRVRRESREALARVTALSPGK